MRKLPQGVSLVEGTESVGWREGCEEIRAPNSGSIHVTDEFGWLSICVSSFFLLPSTFQQVE